MASPMLGMGYGSMASPRLGNGSTASPMWGMGYGSRASPGWGMGYVWDRVGPLRMYFLGGGDREGPPPYVFLGGGLTPKKDGGLSCAQSCRPASLRETGGGVYLSLVEIGASEWGKRAPVMPSVVERWELGVVPYVGERCVTRVYSSVEYGRCILKRIVHFESSVRIVGGKGRKG